VILTWKKRCQNGEERGKKGGGGGGGGGLVKVLFLTKVILEYLGICQVNLLTWLSSKEFIDLVVL
jgi:hypothetical protein